MKSRDGTEVDLYNELWKGVTRSVPGRPNRAVRIHVRRRYMTNTKKGPWDEEEKSKLVE